MSSIRELLIRAVELGASDVHITPGQRPILRISSQLVPAGFEPLSADDLRLIGDELIPPHARERFAEYHECDFSHFEEDAGRFRVNVFLGKGVPAIALRYVKSEIPTLESLNLPPILKRCAEAPAGVVIISGTTSSGKSTTLAALVGLINNNFERRIITIEDPIEYEFTDDRSTITQREVGLDTRSFATGLRQILRQDPDVILIGEVRDPESLRIGIMAAETGHLVLTTLHSGTAAQAIPRLLNEFQAGDQERIRLAVAANLHSVICQRLLPTVHGGLVPAVEIMFNTPMVRKLIVQNQLEHLHDAIETGNEDGLQTFDQAIYQLIRQHVVTERVGLEHATNAEKLRMNLEGIFLDESRRILATN
ncbi:MAG: PilT/PilU family type 4a pilus ATPase [Lentisphaerae bacterium]|jgi:twitching motility protein PilT|nr:PilT/PilU family type 4a pilus ATPase [Lentisphaerota bacterium]